MPNPGEYYWIAAVAAACLLIWLLLGRPNGTEIFLAMLRPIAAIEGVYDAAVALRDNAAAPRWKRVIAGAIAYLGLGVLFVVLFVLCGLFVLGKFLHPVHF